MRWMDDGIDESVGIAVEVGRRKERKRGEERYKGKTSKTIPFRSFKPPHRFNLQHL